MQNSLKNPNNKIRLMTNMEEQKLYYKIGEVAKILKVEVHNVRQWSQNIEMEYERKKGQSRKFTKQDIEKLKIISELKKQKKGLQMKEIEKKIDKIDYRQIDVLSTLREIRDRLKTIGDML